MTKERKISAMVRTDYSVRFFMKLPESLLADLKHEADKQRIDYLQFIEMAVTETIERRRLERE